MFSLYSLSSPLPLLLDGSHSPITSNTISDTNSSSNSLNETKSGKRRESTSSPLLTTIQKLRSSSNPEPVLSSTTNTTTTNQLTKNNNNNSNNSSKANSYTLTKSSTADDEQPNEKSDLFSAKNNKDYQTTNMLPLHPSTAAQVVADNASGSIVENQNDTTHQSVDCASQLIQRKDYILAFYVHGDVGGIDSNACDKQMQTVILDFAHLLHNVK